MKKKILGGLLVVAIAAVAAFNVNMSWENINSKSTKLTLGETEALAGNEWNSWDQWFTQGFTQDEREEKRKCPSSSSSSGSIEGSYGGASGGVSGSTSQTNPSDRYEYICPYGSNNCTTIGC